MQAFTRHDGGRSGALYVSPNVRRPAGGGGSGTAAAPYDGYDMTLVQESLSEDELGQLYRAYAPRFGWRLGPRPYRTCAAEDAAACGALPWEMDIQDSAVTADRDLICFNVRPRAGTTPPPPPSDASEPPASATTPTPTPVPAPTPTPAPAAATAAGACSPAALASAEAAAELRILFGADFAGPFEDMVRPGFVLVNGRRWPFDWIRVRHPNEDRSRPAVRIPLSPRLPPAALGNATICLNKSGSGSGSDFMTWLQSRVYDEWQDAGRSSYCSLTFWRSLDLSYSFVVRPPRPSTTPPVTTIPGGGFGGVYGGYGGGGIAVGGGGGATCCQSCSTPVFFASRDVFYGQCGAATSSAYSTCWKSVSNSECVNAAISGCGFASSSLSGFASKNPTGCCRCITNVYGWCGCGRIVNYCCAA
eukprot:XP_001691015.1 predicted protein [Chlamydomonas reinhardtii]